MSTTKIGHNVIGDNNIVGDINITTVSNEDKFKEDKKMLISFDRSNLTNHFYAFDGVHKVEDIFFDGNYNFFKYDGEKEELEIESCINNCIKILIKDRLLFITGKYGYGKTILTKKLQKYYYDLNKKTYFFRAVDVINLLNNVQFENVFMNELNREETYVFIDSLDDLIYEKHILDLLQSVTRITRLSPKTHFVINSRVYLKLNDEGQKVKEIVDCFWEKVFDELERQTITFIVMKKLTNVQINKVFEDLNDSKLIENQLMTEDIKRTYRKLIYACEVPLFSYVIGDYYYSHDYKLTNEVTDIYEYFVNKTIRGKFFGECSGAKVIEEYSSNYQSLLKQLAVSMMNVSPYHIDYKGDTEIFDTDNNEFPFCIRLSKLSQEANNIYSSYSSNYTNTNKEYVNANFLNCFFSKYITLMMSHFLHLRTIISCVIWQLNLHLIY